MRVPSQHRASAARQRSSSRRVVAMRRPSYAITGSGASRSVESSIGDPAARHSQVPVRPTRSRHAVNDALGEVRTIVVPLDGSDFSKMAVPVAARLARRLSAEVCLFSVVSSEDHIAESQRALAGIPVAGRVQRLVVVDLDPTRRDPRRRTPTAGGDRLHGEPRPGPLGGPRRLSSDGGLGEGSRPGDPDRTVRRRLRTVARRPPTFRAHRRSLLSPRRRLDEAVQIAGSGRLLRGRVVRTHGVVVIFEDDAAFRSEVVRTAPPRGQVAAKAGAAIGARAVGARSRTI